MLSTIVPRSFHHRTSFRNPILAQFELAAEKLPCSRCYETKRCCAGPQYRHYPTNIQTAFRWKRNVSSMKIRIAIDSRFAMTHFIDPIIHQNPVVIEFGSAAQAQAIIHRNRPARRLHHPSKSICHRTQSPIKIQSSSMWFGCPRPRQGMSESSIGIQSSSNFDRGSHPLKFRPQPRSTLSSIKLEIQSAASNFTHGPGRR